jgi:hypothetical protein
MAIFDATLFPLSVELVAMLAALFVVHWAVKKDSGSDRMKNAVCRRIRAVAGETL